MWRGTRGNTHLKKFDDVWMVHLYQTGYFLREQLARHLIHARFADHFHSNVFWERKPGVNDISPHVIGRLSALKTHKLVLVHGSTAVGNASPPLQLSLKQFSFPSS